LDWKKKVEFVFDYQRCLEQKKGKLVLVEFTNYAISWWDQLVTSRKRDG